MNYYILSQGTKSEPYSFVVKNGIQLHADNLERFLIRSLFEATEKKGTLIDIKNSETKIIKHFDNYLIEVLTTNTDRLNRKVPVELLIENYSQNKFTILELNEIYLLLMQNQIEVDEKKWTNILMQLETNYRKFQQQTKRKIIMGIIVSIIIASVILKFIFK